MITLVVSLVVIGLLYYLVTLLPLPSPFPAVIRVIFILILIYVVLQAFGVNVPHMKL